VAKSSILDKYRQWALFECNGAAALTGAVINKLQTGITNMQKTAWEISRTEFWFPPAWCSVAMIANPHDVIIAQITQSGNVAQNADPRNSALIDSASICGMEELTGVGFVSWREGPIIHEFGNNPILALPSSLYMYLTWDTTGNLTAVPYFIKAFYREIELGPEDWYDLLQLRLPLGAV